MLAAISCMMSIRSQNGQATVYLRILVLYSPWKTRPPKPRVPSSSRAAVEQMGNAESDGYEIHDPAPAEVISVTAGKHVRHYLLIKYTESVIR